MSKRNNLIIAGVVGIAFTLFFIYYYLPYANKQDAKNKVTDAIQPSHLLREPVKKVPEFSFTDQTGKTISNKDVDGKVYVADFFYATCKAACPMIATEMSTVNRAINKSEPFRILSYSLDPEHDSVPVLKTFAKRFNAIDSIWHFLTGPKEEIYILGEEGYLQTVLDQDDSIINHSQKVILVDKEGMIRGFYNGLDSMEIQLLIRDINYLLFKDEAQE